MIYDFDGVLIIFKQLYGLDSKWTKKVEINWLWKRNSLS